MRAGVCRSWITPETGRGTAISNQSLRRITLKLLPIEVAGDPIQYQINRTARGWVVELVNNMGIVKKPDQPAVLDPQAVARIGLKPANKCSLAVEWHSRRTHDRPK